MKSFFRSVLVNFLALFLIANFFGGVSYGENIINLFWAAFFLSLFNLLIKPVLNALLMPINLLTLGAFRWIINISVIFLVTLFVSSFKIGALTIPGVSYGGFIVPEMTVASFWALFLVSLMIDMFSGVIYWVFK